MDFEAWNVDVANGTAVHATGFKIAVEGNPADPMGVTPGRFPEGLSAVQQATLLRCGIEALMKAATKERRDHARERLAVVPSAVVAKPKNPSNRPVLSLKR